MENKYQPENPYPEIIYDDASGIAIPNEAHKAWREGFEAGRLYELCDSSQRLPSIREAKEDGNNNTY